MAVGALRVQRHLRRETAQCAGGYNWPVRDARREKGGCWMTIAAATALWLVLSGWACVRFRLDRHRDSVDLEDTIW